MSLQPQALEPVPAETARIAKAAFPKGNPYIQMRDELGVFYNDLDFQPLFSKRGQPAFAPWKLTLITIMQFAEGLTDRQSAEAVRSRIDWKYALSLELTDPGFDFSILSEFRDRLITGGAEQRLLDAMLSVFKAKGWLPSRSKARTDSTHVLAAIRNTSRLIVVGETLRFTLNQLATVAPDWLRPLTRPDWFERYSTRLEEYKLPQDLTRRHAFGDALAADGYYLLEQLMAASSPGWLRHLPAVETLRRVWIQEFYVENDKLEWRKSGNVPPASKIIHSPYDVEARFGAKRDMRWIGYKVHLTETCQQDSPHLITNVETTIATTPDMSLTEVVDQHLAQKELLPGEHLMDAGYVDADLIRKSQNENQIKLIGPVQLDHSWQSRHSSDFAAQHFKVDWQGQKVTCPQGQLSRKGVPGKNQHGNPVIFVDFGKATCAACSFRQACTQAKAGPRGLTLLPKEDYLILQAAREQQTTAEWKALYDQRAGVEGTISQGVRVFEIRKCRYRGLAKTGLQQLASAAAMNLARVIAWLRERPLEHTRLSAFAGLAS